MTDYSTLLLEEIKGQLQAVLEAVGDMQQHVRHIPSIRKHITDISADMRVVQAIAKDLSTIVNNHETRLGQLERL